MNNREIHSLMRVVRRELEAAGSSTGKRLPEVWSDWLLTAEAMLIMLPQHAQAMATTGSLAVDPPEIQERLAQLKSSYGDSIAHLVNATGMLIHYTQPDISQPPQIEDAIGILYMELGSPSDGLGQFFTPWDICRLMAEMTLQDAPAEVLLRIERALRTHPMHGLMMPEREGWVTPEIGQMLAEHFLPSVSNAFEPLTIYDPCCGSGGTLLAGAAMFPRWMVTMGLVRFYGQDISKECVRMARINEMLFGLNGWGMRYDIAGSALMASPFAEQIVAEQGIQQPIIGTQPETVDILFPTTERGELHLLEQLFA